MQHKKNINHITLPHSLRNSCFFPSFFHQNSIKLLNVEQPPIHAWLGQTLISDAALNKIQNELCSEFQKLFRFNKTLDQNWECQNMRESSPLLSASKRLEWARSKFSFNWKKNLTSLLPPLHIQNIGKKLAVHQWGSERAFVQWHNGGHSAVEDSVTFNKPTVWRGSREKTAGLMQKWHSDPADLPDPQAEPLSQLTRSAHLYWPRRRESGTVLKLNFNGAVMSVLKPHMRETLQGNHTTESLFRARHVQTLLSGEYLSGGKSVTTTLLRINLWRKLNVGCLFFLKPDTCHAPQHIDGSGATEDLTMSSNEWKIKRSVFFINPRLDEWHGSSMRVSGVQINPS